MRGKLLVIVGTLVLVACGGDSARAPQAGQGVAVRGFGEFTPACEGRGRAGRAVEFRLSAGLGTTRLKFDSAGPYATRGNVRLDAGQRVVLPMVYSGLRYWLVDSTVPRTRIAAGRLELEGCSLEVSDQRRRTEPGGPVEDTFAYVGVACPTPNSVRCDRLGVAVRLTQSAQRVSARVEGRRVVLRRTSVDQWQGELAHAGLRRPGSPLQVVEDGRTRWDGRDPPVVRLTLSVRRYDGVVEQRVHADPLRPGFG